MQNEKTRDFIRDAKDNGFREVRQNGSHRIFERVQSFSIPVADTELNGCMAKRLRKEFHF